MSLEDIKNTVKEHIENKTEINNLPDEDIELTPLEFNQIFKSYQELQTIESRLEYQHNDLLQNNIFMAVKILFVLVLTLLFYGLGGAI